MFIFEDFARPEDIAREGRRRRILIGLVLSLVVGVALFWWFRNWPEERAVVHFLAALQREDLRGAYQLWKPTSSYRFQDFMRDWGPKGDYGKVQSFEITRSRSRGSGVIVYVLINDREARLWVEKSDKSLAFAPF